MSSIYTAKVLSGRKSFIEREWYYDFRELTHQFNEGNCRKVADSLLDKYEELTKNWNPERNSEWICRTYLSAKMIMTATLQLNAIKYSQEKNLRMVVPYLAYYSLLSLVRAIVYMLPEAEWNNSKLISISHRDAINLAFAHIANFDKSKSEELKAYCLKAKAYRELLSYKSPSSGDRNIGSINNIETISTLLCEVAQFSSELIEASILEHADEKDFIFSKPVFEKLYRCQIGGELFLDSEDYYRLDYIKRKYPVAPNILHIITEGHSEDFFGAWIPNDDDEGDCDRDMFDPDRDWQIIFDIP
ncbi:hypothetical protein [Aeromonas sp. AE23HZ002T15]